VAVLVIPVTVLVTFIVLKLLNQSFDLMTLGGLAAAVGLVIDDAIVIVENVALHRDAGQGRLEAISSELKEITTPLVFSTIYPDRCLRAADHDHRRHRSILPCPGSDGKCFAIHLARFSVELDAHPEPIFHS
jgi:hypothetical protein